MTREELTGRCWYLRAVRARCCSLRADSDAIAAEISRRIFATPIISRRRQAFMSGPKALTSDARRAACCRSPRHVYLSRRRVGLFKMPGARGKWPPRERPAPRPAGLMMPLYNSTPRRRMSGTTTHWPGRRSRPFHTFCTTARPNTSCYEVITMTIPHLSSPRKPFAYFFLLTEFNASMYFHA